MRAEIVYRGEVFGAVEAREASRGFVSERTRVGILQYGGKVDPVFNALGCSANVRFLFLFLGFGRVAIRSYNRNVCISIILRLRFLSYSFFSVRETLSLSIVVSAVLPCSECVLVNTFKST